MTRTYRYKPTKPGTVPVEVAICDECLLSREPLATGKSNPKFPNRGGKALNSRLEKISDSAKEECSHQWRVSGPIGPGWNEKVEETKQ